MCVYLGVSPIGNMNMIIDSFGSLDGIFYIYKMPTAAATEAKGRVKYCSNTIAFALWSKGGGGGRKVCMQ